MLQGPPTDTTFTEETFPAARGDFNTHARNELAYPDARRALNEAASKIRTGEADFTLDDLDDIQARLEAMAQMVRRQKITHLMAEMKERIGALSPADAPDFGRRFVEEMDAHGFTVALDEKLQCNAVYTSYSYAARNRGFVNEVAINPERVDDRDKFILSTAHEYFHGLQKHASPALHHSPFNPETRVVVHPADWILLEAMCERDAFTKEAFLATLLSEKNPAMRDFSLITADEFDATRAGSPSLEDAFVSVALDSLSRPFDRAHPRGKNYVEHYQDVAIKNYSAGMWNRKNEGESDLIFVRLDLEDLWQVGNYDVGPNSFGEHVIEPLFAQRPPLNAAQQEKFDQMCKDYNIPPLDSCPTLRDYKHSVRDAQYAATHSTARQATPIMNAAFA